MDLTAWLAAVRRNSVPALARASRTALPGAAFAAALVSTPLPGQGAPTDSARLAADSLAARLRRAEDAIAIMQQQLADQAASGVATRSRMQLELTGRVLVHAFRNDRDVNNVDDPQFVRPATTAAQVLGLAIRQTTLGLVVRSQDVFGGQFTGDVDVDFYGGQQPSSGGRTFPLLRIRTARGAIRWTHGELLAGQESPLIAGLNPESPAAIGTPAFATAGNLWLWLPQLRGTLETGGAVRAGIQGAVMANMNGDAATLFDTDADAAERSGRPAFEVRARVRWGEETFASEIGCGGHVAWVQIAGFRHDTHAAACDARVGMGRFEVRGEAYTGRGLRGLGGGGISQNVNRSGTPLYDVGGWLQANLQLHDLVRVGGGCGVDEPRESDVLIGGRLRNRSCSGYTIVRPSGPLFIGAEVRRLETRYANGVAANNHLNLAMGFEF